MKLLLLSLLLFCAPLQAAIRYDIDDPQQLARVNDLTLSAAVVEIFWQAYNHPSRPLSPPQAMQRIIDDALLAAHARQTLTPQQLQQENTVGFLLQVQQQDRATALLRKYYEKPLYQAIQQLPGSSLDGIYQFAEEINEQWLQQHFALLSRVNIEATAAQQKLAENTVIARVRLAGNSHTLSLWDIYRRQNVQGRLAIHNADLQFLRGQAKQRAGSLFVLDWTQRKMGEKDFNAVFQIVKNEQDKTTLLRNMGLYADVHDDNPVLRDAAKKVTDAQVKAFYQANKQEFKVVEKVRARHIRVQTQQLADEVHEALKNGLEFSAAVSRYSVADDKHNTPAGDLGWLKRADKNRNWLYSVAFTQPQGAFSMPFRSPQNQGDIVYEIVYIDERVDGFLPLTDPTVRYEASRDVALKQLKNDFYQLQQRLRQQADISLNKRALADGNKR